MAGTLYALDHVKHMNTSYTNIPLSIQNYVHVTVIAIEEKIQLYC